MKKASDREKKLINFVFNLLYNHSGILTEALKKEAVDSFGEKEYWDCHHTAKEDDLMY